MHRSHSNGEPPEKREHTPKVVDDGPRRVKKALFSKFIYNAAGYDEIEVASLEECLLPTDEESVVWINVEGVRPRKSIEAIGDRFNFHSLTVEGISNTLRRPRMEDYGDYLFVVLKNLTINEEQNLFEVEQISIAFGKNFVVTFQEGIEGDAFDPIRVDIRDETSRIRKMGSDFLAYGLMGAVVDNYFLILEDLGERIDELEERLIATPKPETIHEVHRLKRNMVDMRRALWPLREEIGLLEKINSPIIQETTKLFLRDLYDHAIEVIDTVEIYHEILSGMHDTYLSSISNRMNEVMKVLTIIATIFIPLTFIAGVYGMNFDHMPELRWRAGYYIVLALMAVIAAGMVIYFKRRKWM